MSLDFVAIDLETASTKWDTICSVALVRVRGGSVIDRYSRLINPECEFSPINIRIHGITPEMVENAPLFSDIADEIFDFISDDILVSHNMSFDGNVLLKTCARYGIEKIPSIRTLCTCTCARCHLPSLMNHQLPTVCNHYGINLAHHHDACDDALACAQLLVKISNDIHAENLDDLCDVLALDYGAIGSSFTNISNTKYRNGFPIKRSRPDVTQICGFEIYSFYFELMRHFIKKMQGVQDISALRFTIHQNNTISILTSAELFRFGYHSSKGFFVLINYKPEEIANVLPMCVPEATSHPYDRNSQCSRIFLSKAEDIECIADFLSEISPDHHPLSNDRHINTEPNAMRLTAQDFDETVDKCGFAYSDPFVLLDDLRISNPDLSNEIELEQLSDGRTLSYKCCGSLLFYLVKNDKSPFIKTSEIASPKLVHKAASAYKSGEYKYPLNASFRYRQFLLGLNPVCQAKRLSRSVDSFGCCNDFIRCSDAKRCLKANNPEYAGCQYRKNLEAGRIFYGKNKTI